MCIDQTKDIRLCIPRSESGRTVVPVDACIAEEIQELNDKGVITLSCCCGHGRAGETTEWENGFGQWKGYIDPPHALISQESVEVSQKLGYRPFPYSYADGEQFGVLKMYLKTGCMNKQDCEEWVKREERRTPL
ncbi:hypothetical protein ACFQ3J_08850 [Paenibacillus provencensis]|uniref:Uncharacterized protein n=1 Tax=Paenibacillus provencensis TaxID=441151 RepID=A0ABW3PXL0_9BACL|nr:hypothetical protein [Paenibacillus sp. MER 78]MCM3129001.1 hypothetical protein [Paenibacillus sp. MER 78]